jgi:hypothetical protein
MRKKDRYILLAGLVVLVLAGITLWQWRHPGTVRWGHGQLTVSERAWHEARLKRLGNLLQKLALREPRDEQWRIVQPYETYLVIDLRRRALWMEERGQVIEESRCELPGQLTWEAQLADPNGARKLGDFIRLQCRGIMPAQWWPEFLALVGYSRPGEYSAFYFKGGYFASGYGKSPFIFTHSERLFPGTDYYDSMLVGEAEYEQVRRTAAHGGPEAPVRQRVTEVRTNIAPWVAMEKQLYQTIEKKVIRAGFDLRQLTVEPGPDYSGGHAEIQAANDGFLPRLFHRVSHAETYLRIDHLGDGVWYVWSVRNPRQRRVSPFGGRKLLKFEFIVSGGKSLSASEQREWIRRGREYQKDMTRLPDRRKVQQREWLIDQKDVARVPQRWKIELASGVTVELVGIHENPGEGKPWWGPDGTPLERAPCVLPKEYGPRDPGSKVYDIVWRTRLPAIFRNPTVAIELEGGASFPCRSARDYRYGDNSLDSLETDLTTAACRLEETQEKTTLTLRLDLGGRRPVYIRFENISLAPNRDFGFRIEQEQ